MARSSIQRDESRRQEHHRQRGLISYNSGDGYGGRCEGGGNNYSLSSGGYDGRGTGSGRDRGYNGKLPLQ
ncbi:hypothetical protein CRG98_032358 [Punica granatum]|uniref:Uncharacterized protein n=1 Tax=Punica granatum TaxID=22663 RepID=A0A2I0IT87_PUNGR|nr:hypothetical protein CRG98_032358 [Punica granatum]